MNGSSRDHGIRSPGSEFVTGMKKTSVTPAGSPAKGERKAANKKAKDSPSILKPGTQASPSNKGLESFLDVVTERVIDKLCRMDLNGDSPLAAAASNQAFLRSEADVNQIPLIDLKQNSVVMMTVTARRPVPGSKMNLFRGTIHLNTNDIRLSEDVDQLLEEARKKSARKDSAASRTPDKGGKESAHQATEKDEDEEEDEDEVESEDEEAEEAGHGKSANSGSKAVDGAAGNNVTRAGGRSSGAHAGDTSATTEEAEDQAGDPGSRGMRRSGLQRDPRGRKIGSTISCKKIQSLETRFTERVLKLKSVIEHNGYDFSVNQIVDQTEIARVAHGIDVIAFQRLVIFRRTKTQSDLDYAVNKGLMDEEPFFSSPLTPF